MTTLDFLDRGVGTYDDAVGVIAHDGTEYTYAEFGQRVDRAAAALSRLGADAALLINEGGVADAVTVAHILSAA
jgi:non-ribosomal peptide synthetase component E (peptide arylation enzyme)